MRKPRDPKGRRRLGRAETAKRVFATSWSIVASAKNSPLVARPSSSATPLAARLMRFDSSIFRAARFSPSPVASRRYKVWLTPRATSRR